MQSIDPRSANSSYRAVTPSLECPWPRFGSASLNLWAGGVLTKAAAAGAAPSLRCEAMAAWIGRQSHASTAAGIAQQFLDGQTLGPAERGWMHLTLATVAWLEGRLEEASAGIGAATAVFSRVRGPTMLAGLSDVEWLACSIVSDLGQDMERFKHMQRCVKLASQAEDAERVRSATAALWCLDSFEDPAAAWTAHKEEAQAMLEHCEDGSAVFVHCFLSSSLHHQMRYSDAIEHGLSAMRLGLRTGQTRRALTDGANVASALIDLGDVESGLRQIEGSLAIARQAGWAQTLSRCLTVMATGLMATGQVDAALRIAREAVQALEMHPHSKNHLCAVHIAANAAAASGRTDEARESYNRLIWEAQGDAIELVAFARAGLAQLELAQGNLPEARHHAHEAMKGAVDMALQVTLLRLLARCHPADPAERLLHLSRAVELAEEHMGKDFPADLHEEIAGEHERAGDVIAALAAWRAAAQARARDAVQSAARHSIAMEVRYRSEKAQGEALAQRRIAEAEMARSLELQALNGRLSDAHELLRQRNDELAKAYEQIKDLSLTDTLTSLKNRRFLEQVIDADVAHRQRALQATDDPTAANEIAFFLIDMDHFKMVNDAHGHPVGDAVLKELARRLTAATRAEDYVIRWGGEEFLVVTRHTTAPDLEVVARRLLQAVSSTPFQIDNLRLNKTCSIGYATVGAGDGPDATWQSAMQRADQALYLAKEGGRNQAVAAQDHCLLERVDHHTTHPMVRG
jgi:diguanylate cyclase (GGDEF)-like protein